TTMAFELITRLDESATASVLVLELARATGARGMIGGQSIDIASESQSLQLAELEKLHAMKTGALLTSACRLGVLAENGDDAMLERATTYGQKLGLAFQIADDLLDVTSDSTTIGKTAGKDQAAGKNTYPKLLGVEESRKRLNQALSEAIACLDPFNPITDRLVAIAEFVGSRDR
ncbi:MAG TPA: polyprenyl synthetase family protein, partial [Tepidisphaeraceae bacterium]|nr:polyprenyl synthetase family protein [Tepidisphaeraceae bacterium]